MFCSSCGTDNAAGGSFCASCGAPLEGAAPVAATPPPPAPPPSPGDAPMTAFVQGVDTNWRANGDYESIELGQVDRNYIVQVLRALQPQEAPDGDDVCPVSMTVEGPYGTVSVYTANGQFHAADSGDVLTPEQVVERVQGRLGTQVRGDFRPVRHPEVPPTDRDFVEPDKIDTSARVPQVGAEVWGTGILGPALLGFLWLPLVASACVLLGAVAAGDGGVIAIGLVLTGLFAWLMWLCRTKGREEVRIGIDWRTNTFWVHRDGRLDFVPDANCIVDLEVRVEGQTPNVAGSEIWIRTSDGDRPSVVGLDFEKKDEAPRVAALIQHLLATA